jgi:hypothetical protein
MPNSTILILQVTQNPDPVKVEQLPAVLERCGKFQVIILIIHIKCTHE